MPGLSLVRTVPTSCLRVARVADSRLTPSRASVMSPLWSSRSVTRVLTRLSMERTWGSCPASALLSSVVMVFSWLMPPPLRSIDSAPNTSSTSGFRLVRASGMRSPSARAPLAVPDAGGESWMYFSPSRLDCSRCAYAFAGSLILPLTLMVTLAFQLPGASEILVTRPMATSLTFTEDCGARLGTSPNSAVISYGWSPRSAPPGSGTWSMPVNVGRSTVVTIRARPTPAASTAATPVARAPGRRSTRLIASPPSSAWRSCRGCRRRCPRRAAAARAAPSGGRCPRARVRSGRRTRP